LPKKTCWHLNGWYCIIIDDDDYDPDAQLAAQASDKLATLGLDEVIRQQQKPANSLPQTEDVQPSVANKKTQGGLNKVFSSPSPNIICQTFLLN
jgi:hypothetical protein